MVVAGANGASWIALVVPSLNPIKALNACFAGLGLVSVEGLRDCPARCLSCRAAAAVIGAGLGRARLPALGEGSFDDSRRLDERLDGLDGLANVADEAIAAAADDTVEVSVEGSEDLDEDSAIKRPNLLVNEGG
jgi:hypothetical protein